MKRDAIRVADILLPASDVDLRKWAVVAVDQYTSEPEYWRGVEDFVGDAPSALHLTLPEIYLNDSEAHIPQMQANMRKYLQDGTLAWAVRRGYVLVERTTESGARLGLMACLDLEEYDYAQGSKSAIRATEGTVPERVPPRVRIRRGAALELPHILMLLDDPACRVIEPLWEARSALPQLYDFDLMHGGGHLRGWKVDGEAAVRVNSALDELADGPGDIFLAVGDGNHSLAAARAYWLELREQLSEAERATHPARFALAELVNLHCPALQFEPIHRLLTNVDPVELLADWERTMPVSGGEFALTAVSQHMVRRYTYAQHPLRVLQEFLDGWLADHPQAQIDYIHGESVLRQLCERPTALGLMPCALAKSELFPYVEAWGTLPRKTFSMGHANEKRFYLEARVIDPAAACD